MRNLIEILVFVVGILGFAAVGWAALGQFKKSTLEQLQQALNISESLANVANRNSTELTKQLQEMEKKQNVLEQRIVLMEISDQRKTKQLSTAKHCEGLLENIVRVAVNALSEQSGEVRASQRMRVDDLLNDLSKYRSQASSELQEWEETQGIINSYMRPTNTHGVAIQTGPVYLNPQ